MAGSASAAAAAGSPLDDDLILPSLYDIRDSYVQYLRDPDSTGPLLIEQIKGCIQFFKEPRYKDDERLLKIIIIYADVTKDFATAYNVLEVYHVCEDLAVFYETFALFYIRQRKLVEANNLYKKGIARKAQPLENLMKSYDKFLEHVQQIARMKPQAARKKPQIARKKSQSIEEVSPLWSLEKLVDPNSPEVLQLIMDEIRKMKLKLCFLDETEDVEHLISANNIIELENENFQIIAFTDKGAYAKVYKAINLDRDIVVAFKVEKEKPFIAPLEYYMYCELNIRIPSDKRPSFGDAHELHIFHDCNILVCDYLSLGSLWDVITYYLTVGEKMEELVCMFYTIEMLDMLETLHAAQLIHGDFKPDNLMIRNSSGQLTEEGFEDRTGPWRDEGLCLVDWGKGIDLQRFLPDTEFVGKYTTDDYSCIEMEKGSPWIFQGDSYGLCVSVHLMIHRNFMKLKSVYGTENRVYHYLPEEEFESGWNFELWNNLFSNLLRVRSNASDVMLLRGLKNDFQNYICSVPERITDLVNQLAEVNQRLHDREKEAKTPDE